MVFDQLEMASWSSSLRTRHRPSRSGARVAAQPPNGAEALAPLTRVDGAAHFEHCASCFNRLVPVHGHVATDPARTAITGPTGGVQGLQDALAARVIA